MNLGKKKKVNGDRLFRYPAPFWTDPYQIRSIPVLVHIAARHSCGFMPSAAATQAPEDSRCPYFQVLLSLKTAFRWVVLHWSLSHPPSPLYPSWNIMPCPTLPTTLVKLLLREWESFKLVLSPLPPARLKNFKNVLKFLGIGGILPIFHHSTGFP